MAVDRNFLGTRTAPYMADVEKGQLKFFAKVTGQEDPIYFDEAAALMAGHKAIPALPTFIFGLTFQSPRGWADLGIDMTRILHAEQSFQHYAPVYAGDRLTLVGEIIDIYEKKGGALEFVVERTSATNQDGVLCAEMASTAVIRHG